MSGRGGTSPGIRQLKGPLGWLILYHEFKIFQTGSPVFLFRRQVHLIKGHQFFMGSIWQIYSKPRSSLLKFWWTELRKYSACICCQHSSTSLLDVLICWRTRQCRPPFVDNLWTVQLVWQIWVKTHLCYHLGKPMSKFSLHLLITFVRFQ
jgi:hypothetical protein